MINSWHNWLNMTKYGKKWHENDLQDELNEYYEEKKLIKKWSELSDVVYTSTRGQYSGHDIKFPFSKWRLYLGLIYMYPKYTGRWLFFRHAGRKAGSLEDIHEVRNPKKVKKLEQIAQRNNLEVDDFIKICNEQIKHWPLLP